MIGALSRTGLVPRRYRLRLGKSQPSGASTLFGTKHIVMDQWVRLGKRFSGRSRPLSRPILRDSHWVRFARAHRRRPIVTAYHWVRFVQAHRRVQSLQLTIGFVSRRRIAGGQSLQFAIVDSFRNSSLASFREAKLASFGEADCVLMCRMSLVTDCQRTAGAMPPAFIIGGDRERVPGIVSCRKGSRWRSTRSLGLNTNSSGLMRHRAEPDGDGLGAGSMWPIARRPR